MTVYPSVSRYCQYSGGLVSNPTSRNVRTQVSSGKSPQTWRSVSIFSRPPRRMK